MPAGFIAIELVARASDGKLVPDVEDLADLKRIATHEEVIGMWHLEKGRHVVQLRRIGTFAGNLIFEGATSTPQAWNALKIRLGAKLFTYAEAKDRPPAQLAWIKARGYRPIRSHTESSAPAPGDPVEAIHPRHVISGQSAIPVAIPDEAVGRVYYASQWSP